MRAPSDMEFLTRIVADLGRAIASGARTIEIRNEFEAWASTARRPLDERFEDEDLHRLVGSDIRERLSQRLSLALEAPAGEPNIPLANLDWIERQIAGASLITFRHCRRGNRFLVLPAVLSALFGIDQKMLESADAVARVSRHIRDTLASRGPLPPAAASAMDGVDYLGCFINYEKYFYLYRFGGKTVGVLLGSTDARFVGLYDFADESFYHLDGVGSRKWTPWLMARLLSNLFNGARQRSPVQSDTAPTDGGKVEFHVGGTENFAHHIWQNYGELMRLADQHLLLPSSNIVFFGSEFFGPISTFLPSVTEERVTRRYRRNPSVEHLRPDARIPVPVAGTFLDWRVCDAIQARVAELGLVTTAPRACLVMLRGRDRTCLNLTDVIVPHLKRLHGEGVFDEVVIGGFARASGKDHITPRWHDHIAVMEEAAADLAPRLSADMPVTNMVGSDMLAFIGALGRVAFYFAPLGTAHHLIDWFRDCPGVLYLSEQFKGRTRETLAGLGNRRFGSALALAFGPVVNERARSGAFDGRPNLGNFELDAGVLGHAIDEALSRPAT
jgi:hypothetical protein